MLTADIAISTYRQAGIKRLAEADLPRIDGVRYVISWQRHDNAPIPAPLLKRNDILVGRFDGLGQSANRNNSLDLCSADIIIVSDDDLIYYPEGIRQLISAYEQYPKMQLATVRSIHDCNRPFPDKITRLTLPLPKSYYVATFEITMRRELAQSLRFDTQLGLNSPLMHGGEDEVFLLAAIKKGFDCRFLPITICCHPEVSTGLKPQNRYNLRALGCVIRLYYPKSWPLRIPLKALRLQRAGQASLLNALFWMFRGSRLTDKITTVDNRRQRSRD